MSQYSLTTLFVVPVSNSLPSSGGTERKAPGRPPANQWGCDNRIFSRVWLRPAPLIVPGN